MKIPLNIHALEATCTKIRRHIINMTANAASGHPGGSLSVTEILVALYFSKMNVDPQKPQEISRDRLVLSKGHAAPALYACLAERGFFPAEEFLRFRQLHSILQGHPDSKKCPGVDASTGSLGQGASIAVGMALGARVNQIPCHVYCVLGDGELQEGLVWEALMAASHYELSNLSFIVDHNGLQIDGRNDEVMKLGDLAAKMAAFGASIIDVQDGNDIGQVLSALRSPARPGMPTAIICHTVKGKGVSFMENQVGWHGKAPSEDERSLALKELEV